MTEKEFIKAWGDPSFRARYAKVAYDTFVNNTLTDYARADGARRKLFNTLPPNERYAWEAVAQQIALKTVID